MVKTFTWSKLAGIQVEVNAPAHATCLVFKIYETNCKYKDFGIGWLLLSNTDALKGKKMSKGNK